MKKKLKNSLALLLTVCMIITLFPATALAADLPAPSGMKLGVGEFDGPDRDGNIAHQMNADGPTMLGVHFDYVQAIEDQGGYYQWNIEKNGSYSDNSALRETGGGGIVYPFVRLFRWKTRNGNSVDTRYIDSITLAFRDGDSDQEGPSATLNTDITVRQVENTDAFTAYYVKTNTPTSSDPEYKEAVFKISGLPASKHSIDYGRLDSSPGAYDGVSSNSISNDDGTVTIHDMYTMNSNPNSHEWYFGFGDLNLDPNDKYYVDVYDTTLLSDTAAELTITRHPLNFVFDTFDVTVGGSLVYTGSQLSPSIMVKTMDDTPVTLTENTDYTVSYKKNGVVIGASDIINAGNYTAVITGKDGSTYAGKSVEKDFTVAKAVPASNSYTVPTGLTAVYGQTLGGISLPAGFAWEDPTSTLVGNIGTNTFHTVYTPLDSENYSSVTGIDVAIDVSKANQTTPSLALSSATAVVGLTAPALNVSGGNGTGALAYTSSNTGVATVDSSTGVITIVAAGSTTFTVSKAGDTNYNASDVSTGVALTIKDKADISVKDTAATNAAIVAHLKNQGQITVGIPVRTGLTNNFTVAVNGKATLSTYASSNALQGEAKWIGLLIGNLKINNGTPYDLTDLFYKTTEGGSYTQLSADDKSESLQVGGTDKELVLWIKSNVDTSKNIWLATSSGGANEVKLTINFTPYTVPSGDGGSGSSRGGSGGGGGGGSAAPQTTSQTGTEAKTTAGTTTVSASVNAATNTQGTASATIPAETVNGLIEKAKTAEAQNQNAVIEIQVQTDKNAKVAEVSIPKAAFDAIAKDTKAEMKVETGIGAITFDKKALETISSAASAENIGIRMETVSKDLLPESAKETVGDRPVYDFTVTAGNTKISSFNGGTADVSVPYTLSHGEDPNAVVVYYVDDGGKLQTVRGAYDAATGKVEFKVSHFSKYAVGYHKVSFSDVGSSAWYRNAVTFLSARGVTTGTSQGTFAPDAAITRGEFIVMLMRAYGIEPVQSNDNFADAGNTYYSNYLAAAKGLKITDGVGDNLYHPNETISRQDMFTLLYRALDVLGEKTTAGNGSALNKFNDAAEVSSYAKTSVDALASDGVISGSGGKLNPEGNSTRAQMAQLLYNLLSK